MKKRLKENILVIVIAGLAALLGFALVSYGFFGDTITTKIVSAGPVHSSTYEVEEARSKDDPEYDVITNTTKTTHSTKYYRTVVVEVDGKQVELDLDSEFKFMLPGAGRKITISRNYDGSFFWEHPIRNRFLGAALCCGGLSVIYFTLHGDLEDEKPTKKKNKKKKK